MPARCGSRASTVPRTPAYRTSASARPRRWPPGWRPRGSKPSTPARCAARSRRRNRWARRWGSRSRQTAALAEYDADAMAYIPIEELRAAGDPRWMEAPTTSPASRPRRRGRGPPGHRPPLAAHSPRVPWRGHQRGRVRGPGDRAPHDLPSGTRASRGSWSRPRASDRWSPERDRPPADGGCPPGRAVVAALARAGDVDPGLVLVDPDVARQAEDPLGEDVLHDLGGAALDRVARDRRNDCWALRQSAVVSGRAIG